MGKRAKKLGVALCVISVAACCFTACGETENVSPPTHQATSQENVIGIGNLVAGVQQAQGLYLTMTPMSVSEPGVSVQSEESFILTATITPSNAFEQGVDWDVDFVNGTSEWANGKLATDYVTVTPNSGNSATAIVACLAAFGEKIKVTATSKDNESIKAECLLDYAKRFKNVSGTITAQRTVSGTQTTTTNYSLNMGITTVDVTSGGRNQEYHNSFNGHYTWSTGTLTEEVSERYLLIMSDGLRNAMTAQGLGTPFTEKELTETTGLMFDKVCIKELLGVSSSSENWEKLMQAIGNNPDGYDFEIRYIVETPHDSTYVSSKIKINAASMIAVQSVALDQSYYLF